MSGSDYYDPLRVFYLTIFHYHASLVDDGAEQVKTLRLAEDCLSL